MASVTFDHVSKQYGNVTAVNDLDLQIGDREFLVFVGPSGCGKSTSLRMLAGLEEISAGTIYIGEQAINGVEPKDRDIAMVFQSYALYPHMTVYENMAFALKLRRMDTAQIDRRVRRAAEILSMTELLQRKPKQLSGGQRQRVAVGRAIVREPKVFLFDEPLSNLDAKLRVQTRAEITKLHRDLGTTFIYVTHDQTEAMTMGTRIAVMKDGVLQQVDTPQNLYEKPVNIFVAGFMGSPSMNFFAAKVTAAEGRLHVEGNGFQLSIPDRFKEPLTGYVGQTVTLGIRPENIHDAALAPHHLQGSTLSARVDLTELMGNEVFLYLLLNDTPFVARVDPRTRARSGNTLAVTIDLTQLHFFNQETTRAIR
ncbi:sulfate transport system ATP-binding protein [Thermoflexales bacterium]|nr:sulfate transport system ATP-binding protein [Thermoflexales bacterium]